MIAIAALFATAAAWAQALLPVPALTARVIDQTGTLPAAAVQQLEAKLAAFEQKKGSQIAVLMVPTTAPEDIAAYANRVANEWKIGRREVGDGVLVVVAKNDRRMRIEVAKALEGAVPDIAAAQIIDQLMKPAFRSGDFAGGIERAVDQLMTRILAEGLPAPAADEWSGARSGQGGLFGMDWEDLAIFLFFAVVIGGPVLRGIFGGKLGALLTGGAAGGVAFFVTSSLVIAGLAALLALLFTLVSGAGALNAARRSGRSSGGYGGGWSGGGGSWGGGASSGGGFSSGGGGDFGGGGASGDW